MASGPSRLSLWFYFTRRLSYVTLSKGGVEGYVTV